MNHYHSTIQGWGRFHELYAEVIAAAAPGAVLVEIGCWRGKSAAFAGVEIINSRKPMRFFTVDHFMGSTEKHRAMPDVAGGQLEAIARKNLAPVASVVTVLAMASVEAAGHFEDGSVDFLFIDGTHDYDNVHADLTAWLPKMKAGGLVAGDDAKWNGVLRAARELLGEVTVIEPSPKNHYWRAVQRIGEPA